MLHSFNTVMSTYTKEFNIEYTKQTNGYNIERLHKQWALLSSVLCVLLVPVYSI